MDLGGSGKTNASCHLKLMMLHATLPHLAAISPASWRNLTNAKIYRRRHLQKENKNNKTRGNAGKCVYYLDMLAVWLPSRNNSKSKTRTVNALDLSLQLFLPLSLSLCLTRQCLSCCCFCVTIGPIYYSLG